MATTTEKLRLLYEMEAIAIKELKNVRQMIVENGGTPTPVDDQSTYIEYIPTKQKKEKLYGEGTPIGKLTWDDYVDTVGDSFGDARKSDVVKYMTKANPDIPVKRIIEAVKTSLTKKVTSGKLPVTKGASKKEGYIYHFKDRNKMKAA